jgi:hypothetical protein
MPYKPLKPTKVPINFQNEPQKLKTFQITIKIADSIIFCNVHRRKKD